MKKIFYFAIMACLTGFVSACSDDGMDNPYATDDALSVVSNDVMIPSAGGTGNIVVDGNGTVTAESSLDWCTTAVSGNTVTVTATANNSIESRNAIVTIKSGNKSTQVTVYQEGMVFVLGSHEAELNDRDTVITVPVSVTNKDLLSTMKLAASADWMTPVYNAQTQQVEISVKANDTGLGRDGLVQVTCGDYNELFSINQFDFQQDVLGLYYFYYAKDNKGAEWDYLIAQLTDEAIVLYVDEENTLSIPIAFDSPSTFSIDFASPLGVYGKYTMYLGFDRSAYNFLGRYADYFFAYMGATKAQCELYSFTYRDGSPGFAGEFTGNIDLDGDDYGAIDTWYLMAFADAEFAAELLAGNLLTMYMPELEKVVGGDEEEEGGEARRAEGAKSRANRAKLSPYIAR